MPPSPQSWAIVMTTSSRTGLKSSRLAFAFVSSEDIGHRAAVPTSTKNVVAEAMPTRNPSPVVVNAPTMPPMMNPTMMDATSRPVALIMSFFMGSRLQSMQAAVPTTEVSTTLCHTRNRSHPVRRKETAPAADRRGPKR